MEVVPPDLLNGRCRYLEKDTGSVSFSVYTEGK